MTTTQNSSMCDHFRDAKSCYNLSDEYDDKATIYLTPVNMVQSATFLLNVFEATSIHTVPLRIMIRGKAILEMESVTVSPNTATGIVFTCIGHAYPQPSIEFELLPCIVAGNKSCSNEKPTPLPAHDVIQSNDTTAFRARLLITRSAPQPATVRCKASNKQGTSIAEAHLYVHRFDKQIKISVISPSGTIFGGDTVVVKCQLNYYNFTNNFMIENGGREQKITGYFDDYSWVGNYTLTNLTDNEITCRSTAKSGVIASDTIHISMFHRNVTSTSGASWYMVIIFNIVPFVTGGFLLFALQRRLRRSTEEQCNELTVTFEPELIPPEYEFALEKLKLGEKIGAGAFGTVLKAEARSIFVHEPWTTVAVKMLTRTNSQEMMADILSELKTLVKIGQHLNVVNFLGMVSKGRTAGKFTSSCGKIWVLICTSFVGNIMIIYEYCPFGSLDVYLRKNKARFVDCRAELQDADNGQSLRKGKPTDTFQDSPSTPQFRTTELICWAAQVAHGMEHLASKDILHGDLAARNVLLCAQNVVKISDFGLSRTLQRGIYRKTGDSPVPYKWIALECFSEYVFSTKTDVWAYGIFLWELFSLGETPYPGVTCGSELFQMLQDGYRMPQPAYSSQEMFDKMLACWYVCPRRRPEFGELASFFNQMLPPELVNHYIALNDPYVHKNALNGLQMQEAYQTCFVGPSEAAPTILPQPLVQNSE
ncbi:hypothetical protein ZHAS_00009531 [Anopheles sinensis]|uniref:Protein kinase domain-containing protein n=1 Tax=Anopheles sinensis TaxID=74873 RepID=A0A084VVG9_ANOSI|nr:hypothetical protein ZHAS_00009531 [Anopheles sinensis]